MSTISICSFRSLFETTKMPKKSTWILLGFKVSKSPREFLISYVAHILMTFPGFLTNFYLKDRLFLRTFQYE